MPGAVGARVSNFLFAFQEDRRVVPGKGFWGGGRMCRRSRHGSPKFLHGHRSESGEGK